MCGISGFLNSRYSAEEAQQVLDRMNDRLIHRGPDEAGTISISELGAGLASRRLSIVDLSTGRQPISNEDGSIHVVLNGEIYNHRELGAELKPRGHYFSTHTDTEVIAHLYEEHGDDFLPLLDGMFGLTVLDSRRQWLLLARDRCGMKPLYFASTPSGLLFGSEIKAVIAAGHPPQPDFAAIDTYLSLGYVPAPRTCFEGIEHLPAGQYLLVEPSGVHQEVFWQFTFDHSQPRRDDSEYVEEGESLLTAAVKSHLAADVPVGLLLSGGWDSSLIAATAMRLTSGPLKTFSVTFPDAPEPDETTYQRAMSDHLGSEHHEAEFRAREIPELLSRMVRHADTPSIAYPGLVHSKIAGLAAEHVKTVLSGDGSDELLAGYHWLGNFSGYGLRQVLPKRLLRPLAGQITHQRWGRSARVLTAPDDETADDELSRIFTQSEKKALIHSAGEGSLPDLAPVISTPRPSPRTTAAWSACSLGASRATSPMASSPTMTARAWRLRSKYACRFSTTRSSISRAACR
jgi:asparagine synthase (glutamine-hydrolysing)